MYDDDDDEHDEFCNCPVCLINRYGIQFTDDAEPGRLAAALDELAAKLNAVAADFRRTAAGLGRGTLGELILGAEVENVTTLAENIKGMADVFAGR